jgi:hypothetical protein
MDIEHLFQSMMILCGSFFAPFVQDKISRNGWLHKVIILSQKITAQSIFYSFKSSFMFSLYRGKVALEVAEAQHLMEGLDWMGAIKDIQASVKWLKENGSTKVVF